MYQALLTRKYLTTKVMPLLAMAAVALSVGTVLVTWSVMGGFLQTLLATGRTLIGDVTIYWPNTGFAYYEDLVERLEADPEIEAAAPIIETFGMISLPDDQTHGVQIKGVDGESFARVTTTTKANEQTSFYDTLWWKPIDEPTKKDKDATDIRLTPGTDGYTAADGSFRPWMWAQAFADGKRLAEADGTPAAVLGIEVAGWSERTSAGIYNPSATYKAMPDGSIAALRSFLSHDKITLILLPLDSTGRPRTDVVTRTVPVANEFMSGLFEVDAGTVLVNLDLLQRLLDMDQAERVEQIEGAGVELDPETGELRPVDRFVTTIDPARVTSVLVRGTGNGITAAEAEAIKARCEAIYAEFAADHPFEVPSPDRIRIRSWRDINGTMIAAVEKETGLVLFIFGLVCFTTVFLVLAIFWSMVSEKTKDIGILRSLGASTTGIAWLWLRYGAAIGFVGAAVGVTAGFFVVRNINGIHDWLGETFNFVIWDPAVYYFAEIPSDMDWFKALVVGVVGILTCLLGAAIPATRAARMDPVKALRFE